METSQRATEAEQFHKQTGSFLASLGFRLVDEPAKEHSRFRVTLATYRSTDGIYLQAIFNPVDGNSATLFYGRLWSSNNGWSRLSNTYVFFARKLGLDIPDYYELGYGSEVEKCVDKIKTDLQNTLREIKSHTSSDTIVSAEQDRFGARQVAIALFSIDFEDQVKVSNLPQEA